ncbi:2777_t:CDS:2 [Paraglomus brasilianum]|uniref:2777_t:CDS:1 n=1 Tax=Paraglomus brasilianum TaxID=144538 RepID=A0A9N9CE05_9GLOM|nr:2777_t:CDS:2 [Paraglomus brasilianum]
MIITIAPAQATLHGTTDTSTVRHDTPPLQTELSSAHEHHHYHYDVGAAELEMSHLEFKRVISLNKPMEVALRHLEKSGLKAIKKKLSPDLDDVGLNRITLRDMMKRKTCVPDESFRNDDGSPLQVIVNARVTLKRKYEDSPEVLSNIVESAVEKAFSR